MIGPMSLPASRSTLSTFTASDGDNIAVQDWPLPDDARLRGVVLLVHGLGEHAGRYDHVAQRLNAWGFAVRGLRPVRPRRVGRRARRPAATRRLVDDLAEIVDSTRRAPRRRAAAAAGAQHGRPGGGQLRGARHPPPCRRAGAVLAGAGHAARAGAEAADARWCRKVAPNLTVGNGLDPAWLSHDPEVERAYRADPLVHDRISGRLARFIADEGAVVAQGAGLERADAAAVRRRRPAGRPGGSRAFAAAAPPDAVVSSAASRRCTTRSSTRSRPSKVFDASALAGRAVLGRPRRRRRAAQPATPAPRGHRHRHQRAPVQQDQPCVVTSTPEASDVTPAWR
jgi:alpha-beta hydrolase superfamily lysophospholipase